MMITRGVALAGTIALLVAIGCGSHDMPRSVVRSHDCFAAWNARGNERNRGDLAERGFTIGSVERGTSVGDPAVGGTSQVVQSCGYLLSQRRSLRELHRRLAR